MSKLSLGVEKSAAKPMRALPTMTGPGDLRDQHWLDDRIAAIEDGIEAVIDIARNWTDGRNLARLHPDTSAQDYILARVKHPLGRGVVVPLLAESNWSNRQIAAVAGLDESTVRYHAKQVRETSAPDRGPVLGADNKVYGPRVVQAVVIDKPTATPFRVIAQAFERDIRHLQEAYRPHLDDERFAARFGAVLAAIAAALDT